MSGSMAEERIRAKAERRLRVMHPNARIIHELVLAQGGNRIDLAAVTPDKLVVVEIKSERDVLDRLKAQIESAIPVSMEIWLCIAAEKWPKVEHCTEDQIIDDAYKVQFRGGCTWERNPSYISGLRWCNILVEDGDDFREVSHSSWGTRFLDFRALLNMLWAEELRRVAGTSAKCSCFKSMAHALENMTGAQIRRGVYREIMKRGFPRADEPVISNNIAVIEKICTDTTLSSVE